MKFRFYIEILNLTVTGYCHLNMYVFEKVKFYMILFPKFDYTQQAQASSLPVCSTPS